MRRATVAAALSMWIPLSAWAGPKRGTFVQTDTLGMNLVSYNFDTGKTTSLGDVVALSEFFGVHYFVANNLRVGLNFQFSEYLTDPKPGQRRVATFAALPQVGWHFWGPLFVAGVLTLAPWMGGGPNHDVGVQLVFGAAYKIGRLSLTGAIEVPYNFLVHRTIGLTPLLGVALRL